MPPKPRAKGAKKAASKAKAAGTGDKTSKLSAKGAKKAASKVVVWALAAEAGIPLFR